MLSSVFYCFSVANIAYQNPMSKSLKSIFIFCRASSRKPKWNTKGSILMFLKKSKLKNIFTSDFYRVLVKYMINVNLKKKNYIRRSLQKGKLLILLCILSFLKKFLQKDDGYFS